jgi:molybdate transport system substrate-binding protein
MTRRGLRAFLLALLLVLIAACGRSDTSSSKASAAEQELIVFAAASLEDTFTTLATSFRASHPGVEVKLSFAGSQMLRTQIEHGASFDVFASADAANALALVRTNHLGPLSTFAENELVIAVAPSAAAVVRNFADLPRAERLVVGTSELPVGRYTVEVLERASRELGADFRRQVEARVVSRELNVRQVLSKVVLGEAQAGIVYRSDALAAKGRVEMVTIPKPYNVVARYPMAVGVRAPHPVLARAWVDLVRSPEGRAVLSAAGFRVPAKAE